ncbi:hypothetical protein REB14_02160 [Chryseobacterium sp. ES2]|uniref:Peptidase M12B domain-containing protein n=1 Tax=Chryseobacterium metallicongregator TaxID=3073042 RepID=A0ABU1DZM1_9FLAO|nr:hypothetical protein [Chryseobacterium sp. ES2]MDR4950984.1 hypothetical protein [Chryseobacterium sp. ES2]
MKKIMISMAFAATLFISCNNENLETSSSADNGVVTNNGSMYKISELPLIPDFAKPIEKEGEVRKFTLIKNDGSKLYFELTSNSDTLFGKKRTFTGSVNTDGKINEKVIMIVGENGFDLFYKDKDQDFRLKGKSELNIGYKPIEFNPQGKLKTQFLAYAKKNETDGQQLLNQFNKKRGNDNNQYNTIIENSNHYVLLNETAGLQKRRSAERQGKCGIDHLTSTQHELNNKVENVEKNTKVGAYNIEVIGIMGDVDFDNQYAKVVLSLKAIYPNMQINWWQYQFTNSPQNSDGTINQNYIEELAEWTNALEKEADAYKQLEKLRAFSEKHPYNTKRRVRMAAYGDSWNNYLEGLAELNYYKTSTESSYRNGRSVLIISDNYNTTLAHECGHNLGAIHVNNTEDVMHPEAKGFWGAYNAYNHHDVTNISKIKTSLIIN